MIVNIIEPELRSCWRYGSKPHLEAQIQDGMLVLWNACRNCGPVGDCGAVAFVWGEGDLQAVVNIAADFWNKEQQERTAEFDSLRSVRYNTYE